MPDVQPLSPNAIGELLQPYVGSTQRAGILQAHANQAAPAPEWPRVIAQLASYLELILKWSARLNLTAIRDPQEIVRRHFGESLFAGLHLDAANPTAIHGSGTDRANPATQHQSGQCDSLLDLGSGAGFPGVPIQLLYPQLPVTLAESRKRKAAFLREAVRTLSLHTEVWPDRVEAMPRDRSFHTVTLRAVDDMDSAVAEAAGRALHRIMVLGTSKAQYPTLPSTFRLAQPIALPNTNDGALWIAERIAPMM